MARLPKPGSDPGKWADLLNEYLLVAHNPDGTLRKNTISTASFQSGGLIRLSDLDTVNVPSQHFVLSNDGTNLVWEEAGVALRATERTSINVADFGAQGDGITDDTVAIQSAIDSLEDGGSIEFYRGIFMVRKIKMRKVGTSLVGAARLGTRLRRISGTDPLVDMSGTGTGLGHLRYCALTNIMLDGNNLPGALARSYYADTNLFRDVAFVNCDGVATDVVETWDTRFWNCSWEKCGSITAPSVLIRNSTDVGTYGFSEDNTNQIHFLGCRWEGFKNGALRLDGEANGSTTLLNGVFIVSCKMETNTVAGSAFQIMGGTTIVMVNQLYIAIMGSNAGFTTPIDAIEDHGTHIFVTDVYVQWGPQVGLSNSVIHFYYGNPHIYNRISSYHPTEKPATASLIIDPSATVTLTSLWTNLGNSIIGSTTNMIVGGPTFGYIFPIDTIGLFRITSFVGGKDIFTVDNDPTRSAVEMVNATDMIGFADNYNTEKWRIVGGTGAAQFAGGKFKVESSKGYIGIGTDPYTSIGLLVKLASDTDRGLAILRKSATSGGRMLEFQDETNTVQGITFDTHGRPLSTGRVANVASGDQVAYANVRIQARDTAGSVGAAMKSSPTAGSIAIITFSKPYPNVPLSIMLSDHSAEPSVLYVSARSTTGFTVSTRRILRGGSIIAFDYMVMGQS